MDTSLFLVKALGVYFAVGGVSILVNHAWFKKMVKDFSKSPALIFVAGIFIFILGLIMVMFHNVWSGEVWQIAITVISWLVVLKGAMYFVFPQWTMKFAKSLKFEGLYVFAGLVSLALAGWFLYVGFYM
jgi:uncharacterized protein YjeT (DUF2065 family)